MGHVRGVEQAAGNKRAAIKMVYQFLLFLKNIQDAYKPQGVMRIMAAYLVIQARDANNPPNTREDNWPVRDTTMNMYVLILKKQSVSISAIDENPNLSMKGDRTINKMPNIK